MTATPYTSDGRGLDRIAEKVVKVLDNSSAVNEGWKVRTKYFSAPCFEGKKQAGEFVNKDLHAEMNKRALVGNPVEKWELYGEKSTTVIYCANIEHAHQTAAEFRTAGYGCAVINSDKEGFLSTNEFGNEEPTESILARYRKGEFKLIANVGLLTIGYDLPSIRCIMLNTATASLGKFMQMNRASGLDCNVNNCETAAERLQLIENSPKPYAICIDLGGNLIYHQTKFEDIINYSLSGLEKKEKNIKYKVCPQCGDVHLNNAIICDTCQYIWEIKVPIKEKSKIETELELFLVEIEKSLIQKIPDYTYLPYHKLTKKKKELMINCTKPYLLQLMNGLNQNRIPEKQIKAGWIYAMENRVKIFKDLMEIEATMPDNAYARLMVLKCKIPPIYANEWEETFKELINKFDKRANEVNLNSISEAFKHF